jgi:hypothetical protein
MMYIATCAGYCGKGITAQGAYKDLLQNAYEAFDEKEVINEGVSMYIVAESKIVPKYTLTFEE